MSSQAGIAEAVAAMVRGKERCSASWQASPLRGDPLSRAEGLTTLSEPGATRLAAVLRALFVADVTHVLLPSEGRPYDATVDIAEANQMAQIKSDPRPFPTDVDVIDRVLDKGMVIEYQARISISGIDTLVTVDARCVASSIDTYRRYADALRNAGMLTATVGFTRLSRR